MGATLLIKPQKGGVIEAEFLAKEAPETCAAVSRSLPLTGALEHAMFSGEVFFTFVDFTVPAVENAHVVGLQPGDIVFSTHTHPLCFGDGRKVPCEILVVYGPKTVFWDWGGPAPVNLFARVKPAQVPMLSTLANRIRSEGIETVVVELGESKPA